MLESAFPRRQGGADQLLGMVPYLLGYHPTEALVAIIKRPDRPLPRVVSLPLSEPSTVLLNHLTLQIPEKASGIVLIGYGPAAHRAKIAAVSEVLQLLAPVVGRFLYTDGILTCLTPECTCSAADGVPVDPRSTRLAAELAMTGRVALPSRQDVHTLVAADPTAQAATEAALDSLDTAVASGPADLASLMVPAPAGERLTDEQVARLCLALHDQDNLVTAWHRTRARRRHLELWLDVTRRAPEEHAGAPAALVAWSAWYRGQEALSEAALDRARAVDPDHGFTRIVGYLVDAHLPPHRLRWPLTPRLDAPSPGSHS
jgi:hypothetical protein